MPPARRPTNEADRLAALHSYDVLDTACEASFDRIVSLAARLTDCPIALVSLVDAERQWFKARHGLDAVETPRDLAFCAHAILDPSQPLVVPDATKDSRFSDNALVTGEPEIRCYAGVPLVSANGYPLGTLCVVDTKPREFEPETVKMLGDLAQTVSTALELRRAMHEVRVMALTDGLTSLPNRAALVKALGRVLARQRAEGGAFSLLLLDLDGFKGVNDAFGHATGDRVLIDVARVLQSNVRQGDVAGRLGGDEFAVVVADDNARHAQSIAEQIRAAIETVMRAAGFAVTVSIGSMAFHVPPVDETEALQVTDRLLYAAKDAGKNCIVEGQFPSCFITNTMLADPAGTARS